MGRALRVTAIVATTMSSSSQQGDYRSPEKQDACATLSKQLQLGSRQDLEPSRMSRLARICSFSPSGRLARIFEITAS
jgi:hypothetical protein